MILTDNKLDKEPRFLDASEEIDILKNSSSVDLFDQNGYHLTQAEQAFLVRNGYEAVERRHEDCMRYDWIISNKKSGAHINHCDLFERKGFGDCALDQLHAVAEDCNPMLYKLIYMKPKWGVDISIDFVSPKCAFEVFHYEWDTFEYEEVIEKKLEVEELVLRLNWDEVATDIWNLRDEWYHLDFFEQSQWRTDYFGISPEKFKHVIWDS